MKIKTVEVNEGDILVIKAKGIEYIGKLVFNTNPIDKFLRKLLRIDVSLRYADSGGKTGNSGSWLRNKDISNISIIQKAQT